MRLVVAMVVVGLAASSACVTPSIPIPPPDPAKMSFAVTTDSGGQVTSASLTYPPTESYKDGVAYVFNRNKGVGIIQTVNPDGSIGPTPPVAASSNDQLVVSVQNDEQTVSTCVLLRDGSPYCP